MEKVRFAMYPLNFFFSIENDFSDDVYTGKVTNIDTMHHLFVKKKSTNTSFKVLITEFRNLF